MLGPHAIVAYHTRVKFLFVPVHRHDHLRAQGAYYLIHSRGSKLPFCLRPVAYRSRCDRHGRRWVLVHLVASGVIMMHGSRTELVRTRLGICLRLPTMTYIHQRLWESMHARFTKSILHFQPIRYHADIAVALRSELVCIMEYAPRTLSYTQQYLLRAVVGDARLRFRALPPASPLMKVIQSVLVSGDEGDWYRLREAAEDYISSASGVLPPDTTGLPEWWNHYARQCLMGDGAELGGPSQPWDLCNFILSQSGSVVGVQVRPCHSTSEFSLLTEHQVDAPPEGNLAEYIVNLHALNDQLHSIQVGHAKDAMELSRLEGEAGDELMRQWRRFEQVRGSAETTSLAHADPLAVPAVPQLPC